MDALQELKERLDAVVRQLQEALSAATQTRGQVDRFTESSEADVAIVPKPPDEPVET